MTNFLNSLRDLVWGAPLLVSILALGLVVSLQNGFPQLRFLGRAVKLLFARQESADSSVSAFAALCTALAATVGTGNLIGVAGAICLGGPGALLWMWVSGFLGMATKFAEVTLALRYREGSRGGPMYTIRRGLRKRWQFLAPIYCLLGLAASLGVGNTVQIGAVLSGLRRLLPSPAPALEWGVCLILGAIITLCILGGGKRISALAEGLIPFLSLSFILLCGAVLILKRQALPQALGAVFQGAFSPRAVTGGCIGSAFRALSIGCSRGVFTNEAGLGTGSIAHAQAGASHPCHQGLYGILEVFLDTMVMCTLTGLAILVSGVPIPYGTDAGGQLPFFAFSSTLGSWTDLFLTAALAFFAFSTVLGWSLYGLTCAGFLLGRDCRVPYALLQGAVTALCPLLSGGDIWILSEIFNGLMAIPNLISLAVLNPELRRLTIEYRKKTGAPGAGGGTLCRFPSTPTGASPPPCANSIPWRWPQKRPVKKSTT